MKLSNICVVADIYKDYWLEDEAFLKLPLESYHGVIGGNLINICTAAATLFGEVTAIGAVGTEDLEEVTKMLETAGVHTWLNTSPKATGVCVIVSQNKIRTNLIPIKMANADIGMNIEHSAIVEHAEYLFLTGWLFLPSDTFTCQFASKLLLAKRKERVILDMLPHSIDQVRITEAYLEALQQVDILIAIKETFERICGPVDAFKPNEKVAHLRLLLLFYHEKTTGNCYQVEVLNYESQSRYVIPIDHDMNSFPKNYLDEIALRVILQEYMQ